MNPDEIKAAAGYILAGLVTLVAWLGKREVKRLDFQHEDHEKRLRKIEELTSQIMTGPQVLALYSEQKEEFREKFRELRQDHRELRQEITDQVRQQIAETRAQNAKIDVIIAKIVNREQNERASDSKNSQD